jgi:hypothetical protein
MNEIITNGTEIKQRIISEINNASESIFLAMAYFTDREIALAIVGAKNRSVIVDIILSSNIQNETVKLMLRGANIIVHAFETGDARGIMHHKFCLIDNKITINGSYNYSINASNNNVENIHVSDDISTYSQFFSEFERLKFNIENQIAVNTTTQIPEVKSEPSKATNIIDTFSQQLHNLLYSSAQINTEEYKRQGYETSKKCQGSIDIFRTEYSNIEEEIKSLTTDESLSNKKSILTSNISNAFESTKTNLDLEKQEKISFIKKDNELEKRQTTDKISSIQEEKSILESGNQTTGEKGLLQINKEIEKNKLERKTLEQTFVVKKFWTAGNILISFFLFIFASYLLVFFASALYRMLFESDVIRKSLEEGVNPGLPKLVDADAIIKIIRQQGALFGFIGMIFFLFPILLSNIKLLGSERKSLNNILFWVGLVVFDVIVAGMIAINTDEIKCLLVGKESQLAIWEVVKHGEFWMIFMFGMVPLVITHYLIENITSAYKNSKRELVDAEKARKIQILDQEMIELNSDKELINNKVKEKEDAITQHIAKITNLETEINNAQNQIETRYAELQKQIKSIFDDFNARVISGKIFTDVVLDSVIAAYKSGFIEYLPEYYATDEVSNRVREIEQVTNK